MTSLDSHTDTELIALLRHGSEPAFTELYRRHWRSVYRNAMRLLRSAADAEDVVQQAFESIWKRRAQLEIQGSFEAYLFATARYISIAIIQKNADRYGSVSDLSDRLDQAVNPVVESAIDARQLEIAIARIVDTLPKKMRDVFLLSRTGTLTYRQIAERLHISEATVKKQVYYALKIIREQLGDSLPLLIALSILYFLPE
jgi:RNA polymerase sigma-70 factor (ECF subfamily)